VICGAVLEDAERALPFIWQGAPFRLIEGVRLVTVFREDQTV